MSRKSAMLAVGAMWTALSGVVGTLWPLRLLGYELPNGIVGASTLTWLALGVLWVLLDWPIIFEEG